MGDVERRGHAAERILANDREEFSRRQSVRRSELGRTRRSISRMPSRSSRIASCTAWISAAVYADRDQRRKAIEQYEWIARAPVTDFNDAKYKEDAERRLKDLR